MFQKTLGVNDFYFSGGDEFEFPLGNIQMVGKSQAPMFRGEKPGETRFAPTWTLRTSPITRSTSGSRPRTCRCRRTGSRSRATATSAQLHGQNDEPKRPALPPAQVDARRPRHAPRTTCCPHHAYLKNEIPVAGVRAPGGHRAGSAPTRRRSVLDTDCRAHELDNLYVVDTSFFPSIGAVNPALTAMANALRVGDHLLERLGSRGARDRVRACRTNGAGRGAPRVVIIGGGFGGLEAAKRLRKRRRRRDGRSTATTTTCSSRCSTRWRPARCPRARSPRRSAAMLKRQPNATVADGRRSPMSTSSGARSCSTAASGSATTA